VSLQGGIPVGRELVPAVWLLGLIPAQPQISKRRKAGIDKLRIKKGRFEESSTVMI